VHNHLLSVPEVRSLFRDIAQRMPDAVNPVDADGYTCTYDDGNGRRCIVAQVAHEQGWPLPAPDSDEASQVASAVAKSLGWPVTPYAALYLDKVQGRADYDSRPAFLHEMARPTPWGVVDF